MYLQSILIFQVHATQVFQIEKLKTPGPIICIIERDFGTKIMAAFIRQKSPLLSHSASVFRIILPKKFAIM